MEKSCWMPSLEQVLQRAYCILYRGSASSFFFSGAVIMKLVTSIKYVGRDRKDNRQIATRCVELAVNLNMNNSHRHAHVKGWATFRKF